MRPTRLAVLVALALGFGVISWLVVTYEYESLPGLPVVGPLSIAILAIAEMLFAFAIRKRLRDPNTPVRRRLEPIFVARLAVLAKASSHAAAIVGGVYGGFFVYTLLHLEPGQLTTDARVSGISAAISVALAAAALFLEHSCRVPPHDGDGPRFPA